MASHVFADAGKAVAEEGIVLQDGPDGIAIAMTPDAAEQTAHELIRAAVEARQQAGNLQQTPTPDQPQNADFE